jgi:hypothetical protein
MPLIAYLKKHKEIFSKQAQQLWNVTGRTTSSRFKKMCMQEVLVEISTNAFDPQKKFSLRN